jgi:hypothetical protein
MKRKLKSENWAALAEVDFRTFQFHLWFIFIFSPRHAIPLFPARQIRAINQLLRPTVCQVIGLISSNEACSAARDFNGIGTGTSDCRPNENLHCGDAHIFPENCIQNSCPYGEFSRTRPSPHNRPATAPRAPEATAA